MSGGELTILVIEGKVEGIDFSDDVPFAGQKLRLAFPGIVGNALNIRDLEQGLDQLNRLPSNDATMELVPGTTAGMSRVRIANTPGKTWRASAGLDNSRNPRANCNTCSVSRRTTCCTATICSR